MTTTEPSTAACPPFGLTLPAEFVRARDADTIEWRLPGSAFIWASRLIDVWAPEINAKNPDDRKRAAEGKTFVSKRCALARSLTVHVPLPDTRQPLKALTFDRVPSWVWIDGVTSLNKVVVQMGFAASMKGGRWGE